MFVRDGDRKARLFETGHVCSVYFYNVLQGLIDLMPSKTLEFLMYAAILNPFICSYLIYLAKKSIKKDDDLVSSLNRIR